MDLLGLPCLQASHLIGSVFPSTASGPENQSRKAGLLTDTLLNRSHMNATPFTASVSTRILHEKGLAQTLSVSVCPDY